jgi:outer membrane protein OmpA-like peptidoglycan-associated protein
MRNIKLASTIFLLIYTSSVFSQKNKKKIKIENLSINTIKSEFGVSVFNDSVFYFSREQNRNIREVKEEDVPFFDIVKASQFKNGNIIAFNNDLEFINSNFDEGAIAFSPNKRKVYFTRTNYQKGKLGKTDSKGKVSLKLYTADLIDNEWTNVRALPFNSNKYSTGHPTVSLDGERLYFISDMPNGFGQTDIYYVKILDKSKYSNPINLGEKINTKGKEMFPFIKKNTLYFSSDAHQHSLGNLDIYSSIITQNEFQKPILLEKPINSEFDDFAYVSLGDKNSGYFSSNRSGGKGGDDIYKFEEESLIVDCLSTHYFNVTDSGSSTNINDFSVKVIDNKNIIFREDQHLNSGFKFTFKDNCSKKIKIQILAKNYQTSTLEIKLTDGNFDHNISLVSSILQEKYIVLEDDKVKIKIDNIYFDSDSYNLTFDAMKKLDVLIAIMTKYPNIKIKISSHTDANGSKIYNQKLSTNRAISIKNYIWSRNISKERIFGKGYGEEELINNCKDNVFCEEYKHAENRRTEFEIVNILNSVKHIESKAALSKTININSENKINSLKNRIHKNLKFSIQIGIFKNSPTNSFFTDNKSVFRVKDKELTRYYYGVFSTREEAMINKKELINKGIKDSFIVRI